jgi:hypothetical protein
MPYTQRTVDYWWAKIADVDNQLADDALRADVVDRLKAWRTTYYDEIQLELDRLLTINKAPTDNKPIN